MDIRNWAAGLLCGILVGPLLILAALVLRSNHPAYEYEAAMLTDGSAAIEIRIDGIAPIPRQQIDLPLAGPSRLVLFEPYARAEKRVVLDILRRDAGSAAVLKRMPLDPPRGDTRCIVVVTVEAGAVAADGCRSLLRYM